MGRIVHFELPADNPEKMIDFYTKVFKWKFQKWAENDYWLTDTGQSVSPAINGAIVKRQGHFRNVINTINVDNIDKTIEDITKNGGTVIVPKMTIPNVGHIAYFNDTDGNTMGLIEDWK